MRRPIRGLALPALAALAGTLAACGQGEGSGRVVERGAAPSAASTDAAANAAAATTPASAAADFVGVWALQAEQCARNRTWRFTADRLAADGVNCAIEGAARAPQGWRLQASCTVQGQPRPAQLDLALDEVPAGGMTLSGGPFGQPVSLVRCTPPLNAPA